MSKPEQAGNARPTLRIDKWLWQARFFKTRGLASKMVLRGKLRVNGQRVAKPGRGVGAGDVLTFVQAKEIRVVRVLACGARRGPAVEAQALYFDLQNAEHDVSTLE
ncbi:MAG: RNA-binding S4 domain-containing protein [Rhodobacteraceae bacterium]|nr:RNA-binding S4 domain-containing protein [Paracoccaceae bacterium]